MNRNVRLIFAAIFCLFATQTVVFVLIPLAAAEMGLMRIGDCNNDNVVNAVDFALLRNSFGKSVGQAGYDDRAEFTGDGVVNAVDFILLRDNFGLGGASPISP